MREPARGPGQQDPAGATGDRGDFARLLEQLVDAAVAQGWAGDPEALDATGAAVLRRVSTEIVDPDYRALNVLADLPSEDRSAGGTARRRVCLHILRCGLERKLASWERGGSRSPLDELVTSLLDAIPLDEYLALDLGALLTGTRYLGAAHEAPVLDLVTRARTERYLLPLAAEILQTLWHNLRAEGARTPRELLHLALIFRSDGNPAKRLVAMRYLLVAMDSRYREFAVTEALASRDLPLIRELARTAADQLPPREALAVLQRLHGSTGRGEPEALAKLWRRDPEQVADAYRRRLESGSGGGFRGELVGSALAADGLRVARMALARDPDPRVRALAAAAVARLADPALGERTLLEALGDAELAADPTCLGFLVDGLDALTGSAGRDAVHRVGAQMARCPALGADLRRRVKLVLDRMPPGR